MISNSFPSFACLKGIVCQFYNHNLFEFFDLVSGQNLSEYKNNSNSRSKITEQLMIKVSTNNIQSSDARMPRKKNFIK